MFYLYIIYQGLIVDSDKMSWKSNNEKYMPCKEWPRESWVTILTSEKVDFRTKLLLATEKSIL
jgi:hypothetical protein